MFTVAITLADMAWGGYEEGGWWYRYSIPQDDLIEHLRGFTDREDAIHYAIRLDNTICAELNEGRPSINEINSLGIYSAEVYENSYPRPLPDRKPHYE